ncbi:MAG: cysteine synthase A [Victivallaceae bacterium]|nr:cysteine synthase A [Victivallaceae bacterium]
MIYDSLLDLIGRTPLVRIHQLNDGHAEVLAKLESFNPGGSSKDRIALAMIEAAEKQGLLKPGATVIEPTSGNTGIGLALCCAIKGYFLVLTMPDTMSEERRMLLAAYGAKIVLTPGKEGMSGSIAEAQKLHRENPNSIIPQQFENPANPAAHEQTTGPEIWEDCDHRCDVFVAGVGTGGTLSGTARYLKRINSGCEIVAVEPDTSQVLAGQAPGPHKLQGIGANFVPGNFDRALTDKIMAISAQDAGRTARDAARREGILIGISSGAALFAALELSRDPKYAGKRIVVLLPDSGERYLSTWLFREA